MPICACPASAALTAIPGFTCPEFMGQIQKVAFQRLTNASGVKNKFVGTGGTPNSILLKASWTAFLSASDATKIIVSPYIEAPAIEAGAARTFGGGNETLGGIEEVIGREPTPFTGVIRKAPQSIIKVIKKLECETNLGVYLFDENGAIGAIQDATVSDTYYPIPVRSFFMGDKSFGMLEGKDNNAIQWIFPPNYSDDLKVLAPTDFNPLTDL